MTKQQWTVALVAIGVSILLLDLAIQSGLFKGKQQAFPSIDTQSASSSQDSGAIKIPMDEFAVGEFEVYSTEKLGLEIKVPKGFKVEDTGLTEYDLPVVQLEPTSLEYAGASMEIQRLRTQLDSNGNLDFVKKETERFKSAGLDYRDSTTTINNIPAYIRTKTQSLGTITMREFEVILFKDKDFIRLTLKDIPPAEKNLTTFGKMVASLRIFESIKTSEQKKR